MGGLTADEEAAMRAAADLAVSYRQGLADRPVPAQADLDEIVAAFRAALGNAGQPADAVIRDLAATADPGIAGMSSPNFYAYVLGGSMPVGVAADMLVSAWGQNAGSSVETPAITGMERAVCDWILELLDLPRESGVGLVTGATVANTQGVMAARNALLARRGWDVEEKGLYGAPEIPVLIGAEAHSAPFAALRYAGLGAGRALRIATDDEGRIRPDDFAEALEATSGPPLAILQAGQINTGAFDPFAELIPMVHARGGWVHVDGAFGLWLRAVPELRGRLAGLGHRPSQVDQCALRCRRGDCAGSRAAGGVDDRARGLSARRGGALDSHGFDARTEPAGARRAKLCDLPPSRAVGRA